MKLKPQTTILIVLLLFAVGIAITSVTGLWNTKAEKEPAKLSAAEYSGSYDPADIRGSYTFSQISEFFQIPIEDLSAAFCVPQAQASGFKCKDLETIYEGSEYEIGTGSVRLFTAYYLGLPYTPSEETYVTQTAAELLEKAGNMTDEQRAYVNAHAIPAS